MGHVAGYGLVKKVLATFFIHFKWHQSLTFEKAIQIIWKKYSVEHPEILLLSPSFKVMATCEDCIQLTREGHVLLLLELPTPVSALSSRRLRNTNIG